MKKYKSIFILSMLFVLTACNNDSSQNAQSSNEEVNEANPAYKVKYIIETGVLYTWTTRSDLSRVVSYGIHFEAPYITNASEYRIGFVDEETGFPISVQLNKVIITQIE